MLVADLHIHSKYSRATSASMNLEELEKFAALKGIGIIGTGDFTHPKWIQEIKTKLSQGEDFMKSAQGKISWVLTAEVSNIYSTENGVKKIHHIILAPSIEVAEQINDLLRPRGNLLADGRPIFGKFPSPDLVELVMSVSKDCEVIPAHIWTPWFSLFGSNSGFDSIKDCYQDQLKHIHALETGLSSDPAMNWRLSQLDNYSLVSNSDSHSPYPWRIGREANIFEVKNYKEMLEALRTKDPKKFLYTIEVDPNYGKYHYDGHRACGVRLSPAESNKIGKICPKCGRPLTIGVLNRVEELADRPEGFIPKVKIPFKSLIPLSELIASLMGGAGIATRKVWDQFYKIVTPFQSELNVLLNASREELLKHADEKLVDVILQNREGGIKISPGYDGVYGVPVLFGEEPPIVPVIDSGSRDEDSCGDGPPVHRKKSSGQRTISDF